MEEFGVPTMVIVALVLMFVKKVTKIVKRIALFAILAGVGYFIYSMLS